jgi:hypothetical protein
MRGTLARALVSQADLAIDGLLLHIISARTSKQNLMV